MLRTCYIFACPRGRRSDLVHDTRPNPLFYFVSVQLQSSQYDFGSAPSAWVVPFPVLFLLATSPSEFAPHHALVRAFAAQHLLGFNLLARHPKWFFWKAVRKSRLGGGLLATCLLLWGLSWKTTPIQELNGLIHYFQGLNQNITKYDSNETKARRTASFFLDALEHGAQKRWSSKHYWRWPLPPPQDSVSI